MSDKEHAMLTEAERGEFERIEDGGDTQGLAWRVQQVLTARTADFIDRLHRVGALHARRDGPIYDEAECADASCGHPEGTCVVVATAVCAHCADQTEPDGDWEHLIRPDAYWPCATVRALLPSPSADQTDGHDHTSHAYVSTACLHGEHDRCRRVCKFCDTPCLCTCGHTRGNADG